MKIDIKISNDDEIWKDIEGHDNLYQISNNGRIKKKSYIQEYTSNPCTLQSNYSVQVKRVCGERMLVPQIRCRKPALVFTDQTWVWIDDLMNKYFK